jgi:hypothetical protein
LLNEFRKGFVETLFAHTSKLLGLSLPDQFLPQRKRYHNERLSLESLARVKKESNV